MGFLVRVEAVQRISEYNGSNSEGNAYCIASWKVKNVVDGTVMLVSCFGKDDDVLKNNPTIALDGTLEIVCRDWSKNGKSGSMNNVTLKNLVGPTKPTDVPGQAPAEVVPAQSIFNPADNPGDLPF